MVFLLVPALYFILFRPMVRYVNERRKIEEELKESEKKYNDLFEKSEDGNLIIVDGRFTECNHAIVKMLRYKKKEDLLNTHPSELSPEIQPDGKSSYEKANEMIDIALEKGSHRFEWIHRKADGEVFPVEVLLTVVNSEKKMIHTVLRDITRRKQAELEWQVMSEITHGVTTTANLDELLKLIHNSLRKVLYAENCFFALYDQNTSLFSFPYFVDQFDSAPSPLALQKSCTGFVFRKGESMLIDNHLFKHLKEQDEVELVGSNSPSWIGVPLKTSSRKIGVLVLQHYQKENVYDEDNLRFLDSIGSQVANVIERKRAEEELKESEQKFRTFFEKSPIGIEIYDAAGNQTDANPASLEMFGIEEKGNVLGFNIFDGTSLSMELKEQLLNGNHIDYTSSFNFDKIKELKQYKTTKTGKVDMQYSITPMKSLEGKIIMGYLLLVQNITKRKRAEEALKASEASLHEMNATKDKFFSIIAHDLTNPFNAIIGFSNILTEQIREQDYEGIEEYAGIIKDSSQRTLNLLLNLLEWSRSQTGRIAFNPETIDIGELINEVAELLDDAARQKSITISRLNLQDNTVFADKAMIGTILRNLISNAVKFTNPGGEIVISAEQKHDELILIVSDSGVGIKKEAIDKLFRIEASYSTMGTQNEQGTGLGLILCKEFIEKHGGKIWAESEVGKGSRFYFTIPKGKITE